MFKSRISKLKAFLVRKQLALFGTVFTIGMASLVAGISIVAGTFPEIMPSLGHHLISEGIAFIIIGLVGTIMSWTTFEIGSSIKELVREVGVQNQEALKSIENTLKNATESQDRIATSQDRIATSQDKMAASQDRIATSQDKMAESLKEVSGYLKENSKILQNMLESQKEMVTMIKQIKDGDRA